LELTSAEIEFVVLFLASEESAFYEIPPELRRFFPDSVDLVNLSQRTLSALLRRGLIYVFCHEPVDITRAEAIIASDSAWQVPDKEGPHIYLHLMDTGLKALQEGHGVSKRRQRDVVEEFFSGPYGLSPYPYGLSEEKIAYWAGREPRPVMPKYQETIIGKLYAHIRVLLGKLLTRSRDAGPNI
jgi:hypothetical protein